MKTAATIDVMTPYGPARVQVGGTDEASRWASSFLVSLIERPARPMTVRRFELHRDEDETGVSGTGVVAEGVCWADGSAALHWLTEPTSTGIYSSMETLVTLHGHGGKTRVVWIDGVPDVP